MSDQKCDPKLNWVQFPYSSGFIAELSAHLRAVLVFFYLLTKQMKCYKLPVHSASYSSFGIFSKKCQIFLLPSLKLIFKPDNKAKIKFFLCAY